MRIGVIGLGVVGEAVAFGLRRIGREVIGHDPPKGIVGDILSTDLAFVCVPTPSGVDGVCHVSIVESVVEGLMRDKYEGLIVIKSTVPPGTTARLRGLVRRIAFCPEFLRERARFTDFCDNHEICIAGVYAPSEAELIRAAHGSIPKHFAVMTPTEAELAKYFVNCFNAYRINFANRFYDVCRALDADYERIKAAVSHRADTRSSYMDSNENLREFGGACLPKDTRAFAAFVRDRGLPAALFEQIVEENERVYVEKVWRG